MIVALLAASTGILLLALLIALLHQETENDSVVLREALGLETTGTLPPRDIFERIFNTADLDFIAAQGCRPLIDLIAADRRHLALAWLRTIKREAFAILAAHRKAVRHHQDLRQSSELRLAVHVAGFYCVYLVVYAFVGFRGAFRLRSSIGNLRRLCEYLARLRSLIVIDAGLAPSWDGVR